MGVGTRRYREVEFRLRVGPNLKLKANPGMEVGVDQGL